VIVMTRTPTLRLASDGPRFTAIARALADEIRRGRLVAGQRLPSSRHLAAQLGVHRNTVVAALADLVAQGWITTTAATGTFVSSAIPSLPSTAATAAASGPGFRLPSVAVEPRVWSPNVPRGSVSLAMGIPDARLFPVDALARAWRRVVRRNARTLLTYGPPEGYPPLRRALAELLRVVRAVPATADHVLVTRGSQMALDLCARGLLRPGDRVAVEALGYRPAWDALTLAGAQLVPIAVDHHGLDVVALTRAHARTPIRAVYVTPHHQYPTTVTMSAARRLALLDFARRHRVVIVEDDYDHEFHFDGNPVAPLAANDPSGQVIYIGTLSKVLAPGLRLGFIVAPPTVVGHLAHWRAAMDRQGDQAMEAAVAELIDDGELERHMRRMRVAYQTRRDVLVRELGRRLGTSVSFATPRGGISLWVTVDAAIDVATWVERCAQHHVEIAPGARYTFDHHEPNALRLVYAPNTAAELTRAVAVMTATQPAARVAISRPASGSGSMRRGGPSGPGLPRR
jgi:GntR family transcriptional regulator / MocR family aminotransferase